MAMNDNSYERELKLLSKAKEYGVRPTELRSFFYSGSKKPSPYRAKYNGGKKHEADHLERWQSERDTGE